MRNFLGWVFLVCWILAVANVMSSQVQVALLGGTLFPALAFKVAVVILPILGWFFLPNFASGQGFWKPWTLFFLCITVSAVVVYARHILPVSEQFGGLIAGFLYFAVIPLHAATTPTISSRQLAAVLLTMFLPLALLGIAQFVLNLPLVAVDSNDKSLMITSWDFYGQVRAFSLFASGLDFSFFLALCMGLFTAYLVRSGPGLGFRLVLFLALLIGSFATYATLTRVAYLFVPITVYFSFQLARKGIPSKLEWVTMPFAAMIIGVLFVIVLPVLLPASARDTMRSDSLLERLFHWQVGLDTWLNSGSATFWFGNGVTQGVSNDGYIVDNTFINLAVQCGAVGLVGGVIYLFSLWMSLRQFVRPDAHPVVIAIVSFWGTFLLTGMFNVTSYIYGLLFLPLVLLRANSWAACPAPLMTGSAGKVD